MKSFKEPLVRVLEFVDKSISRDPRIVGGAKEIAVGRPNPSQRIRGEVFPTWIEGQVSDDAFEMMPVGNVGGRGKGLPTGAGAEI